MILFILLCLLFFVQDIVLTGLNVGMTVVVDLVDTFSWCAVRQLQVKYRMCDRRNHGRHIWVLLVQKHSFPLTKYEYNYKQTVMKLLVGPINHCEICESVWLAVSANLIQRIRNQLITALDKLPACSQLIPRFYNSIVIMVYFTSNGYLFTV